MKIYRLKDTNGVGLSLTDILAELEYSAFQEQECAILLQTLFCNSSLKNALVAVLQGRYDDVWRNTEEIRQEVVKLSDGAARECISDLLTKIKRAEQEKEDLVNLIKEMKEQWPEPYKKYIPKQLHTYASAIYLSEDETQKLLAQYEPAKKES